MRKVTEADEEQGRAGQGRAGQDFSDEYPLALRIVVITLLVPADTSECERVFSLMNDIKTELRSTMKQKTLKHLMIWHSIAKDLKCEEVPVMDILKKFRDCAGIRGRRRHTGTNPPSYGYNVMPEASTSLTVV